jgi:hypothetical protein
LTQVLISETIGHVAGKCIQILHDLSSNKNYNIFIEK